MESLLTIDFDSEDPVFTEIDDNDLEFINDILDELTGPGKEEKFKKALDIIKKAM